MKKRIENIFTGVASNIVYGLLLLLVTYIGLKFDDKSLDDYLHSYSFYIILILILIIYIELYWIIRLKKRLQSALNKKAKRMLDAVQCMVIHPERPISELLEPFITAIYEELGEHKKYKITIVQPVEGGRYRLLASRGIYSMQKVDIEKEYHWNDPNSNFMFTTALREKKEYDMTPKDAVNDMRREETSEPSASHFIIALKHDKYTSFHNHCIALIGIGIPKDCDFDYRDQAKKKRFYDSIYHIIKEKEIIILLEHALIP